MKHSPAYWRKQRRIRANRIRELANAIAQRRRPESTYSDLYAIGSSMCSNSNMIDKAINLLEKTNANNSKS